MQLFSKSGFLYEEIIAHLKRHDINIGLNTLLRRRLELLGPSRRSNSYISQNEYLRLKARIGDMINGQDSCSGYSMAWYSLRKFNFLLSFIWYTGLNWYFYEQAELR